jgi:hypothetical protein
MLLSYQKYYWGFILAGLMRSWILLLVRPELFLDCI